MSEAYTRADVRASLLRLPRFVGTVRAILIVGTLGWTAVALAELVRGDAGQVVRNSRIIAAGLAGLLVVRVLLRDPDDEASRRGSSAQGSEEPIAGEGGAAFVIEWGLGVRDFALGVASFAIGMPFAMTVLFGEAPQWADVSSGAIIGVPFSAAEVSWARWRSRRRAGAAR